jgi:hypothetical protein
MAIGFLRTNHLETKQQGDKNGFFHFGSDFNISYIIPI